MKSTAKIDQISLKAKLDAYLPQVPASFRKTLIRSVLEGRSRSSAIKAKCQNCVGYEEAHKRIRECSSQLCPLWRLRPYQQKCKQRGK